MANSFQALVSKKATTKKPASKGKKDTPVIELNEKLSKQLAALIKAKENKRAAEAALKQAEEGLLEVAQERQDNDGFKGVYSGTYVLKGKDTSVKYIASDRYNVPQEDEALSEIEKIVGKKAYGKIIEEEMTVSLRPEVFQDPEKQELLVKLVGDKFDELFETTVKYKAASGLKENIYSFVKDVDKLQDLRDVLPQYKASIR